MDTYKVVRMFFRGGKRTTIKTGLTLQEAQEHCHDKETSSTTATSYPARKRTARRGPWFDGYTKE